MQTIVAAMLPAFMVLLAATGAQALSVGDPAPDFTLPSTQGTITLSDYQGKKPVVLAFYFKDFTSG
jgi:peroxiredoxin Q/BCP